MPSSVFQIKALLAENVSTLFRFAQASFTEIAFHVIIVPRD